MELWKNIVVDNRVFHWLAKQVKVRSFLSNCCLYKFTVQVFPLLDEINGGGIFTPHDLWRSFFEDIIKK